MLYIYLIEAFSYLLIIGILFIIFKVKKIKQLKYILILLPIFMILTLELTFVLEKPEINIEETIKYEVGQEADLGKVEAIYHFKDVSDKVKVEGNVDFNKIGKYEVKYIIPTLIEDYTEIHIIEIVDTTPPEIKLEGNEVEEISYKEEYKELGFTVTDNSSEELKDNVEITKEEVNDKEYKLIYTVEDSSKNVGTVTRTIKLVDKEKPEISLNGESTMYLKLNAKYSEQGAKATDEIDGDLTDKIEVTGEVNTAKSGEYTVTYTVKDNSGNEAKKTRTIYVNVTNNINTNQGDNAGGTGGTIFLTFDDGPTSTITPQVLDILKSKGVKATFFILNYSAENEKLVKREVNEGHTVGIHGYSHDYKAIYQSVETYMANITRIQDKIKASTGYNATITRFPGGSSNTVSRFNPGIMTKLTKEVVARGYKYFDWNVSSGDAGGAKNSSDVYNSVISGLKHGRNNVVLMHDFSGNTKTVNALSSIIDYGFSHGYTFSNITTSTPMVTHGVNN